MSLVTVHKFLQLVRVRVKIKLCVLMLLSACNRKNVFLFSVTPYSNRLVLSRFEIEGAPLGENSVESEEDEEEVWLFWKDSNKEIRSKSIRELAQDAKEGQKEDQEVISYYR